VRATLTQGKLIPVAWKPPELRWIKVNSEGALEGEMGQATAGGVIRGQMVSGLVASL
jgi:hypothetical protein